MDHILLSKYFAGECSKAEKKIVEAWSSASIQNEKYFNESQDIWKSSNYEEVKEPDLEAAWEKVNAATRSKSIGYDFRPFLKIAATLFLVMTIALFFYFKVFSTKELLVTTGKGEKKEISLPDGTKVWLNESSALSFPEEFNGDTRDVVLKGEGFFEVARDEKKAFLISSGSSVTKVLGTSFGIYQYSTGVEISVVSGKVAFFGIDSQENGILLTAGQNAALLSSSNTPVIRELNDPNFLAWHTGTLLFERSTLQEVVKRLEKHYEKKIVLENEKLKECLLTATFKKASFEEIMETLEGVYDLKYVIKGDMVTLKEGQC